MSRIRILGDHSTYHCGSWAVIEFLRQTLGERHHLVEGEAEFDILVVNGEGSMHNNASTFRKKMEALRAAQQASKRTFLVNSVWENNGGDYDDVLRRLEGIFVREIASQQDLKRRHRVDSVVRIDCSYFCELPPETGRALDLNGRDCITDFFSREASGWVRYTEGSLAGLPYLDMKRFGWSDFVQTLSRSSLLITGRHHAVFAACKAKTPFVAIESNTHKISGFIRMAGLPIPVCTAPRELAPAIQWARQNRAVYDEFFDFLERQPALSLSDLGL